MRICVNGDVMSVISTIPAASLKKYGSATVKEDGKTAYAVCWTNKSNLNSVGVNFTHATEAGFAACNIALPHYENVGNSKNYILDNYSDALSNLAKYEEAIKTELDRLATARASIEEVMEVM